MALVTNSFLLLLVRHLFLVAWHLLLIALGLSHHCLFKRECFRTRRTIEPFEPSSLCDQTIDRLPVDWDRPISWHPRPSVFNDKDDRTVRGVLRNRTAAEPSASTQGHTSNGMSRLGYVDVSGLSTSPDIFFTQLVKVKVKGEMRGRALEIELVLGRWSPSRKTIADT